MDLAQEKGASSWLTALSPEEHGFTLHKSAFRDAMASGMVGFLHKFHLIVCGVNPSLCNMHSHARKESFLQSDTMSCLTSLLFLLKETCHGVTTEPSLQPITSETFQTASVNKQDGAQLGIVANGFWGGVYETAFLMLGFFLPICSFKSSLIYI